MPIVKTNISEGIFLKDKYINHGGIGRLQASPLKNMLCHCFCLSITTFASKCSSYSCNQVTCLNIPCLVVCVYPTG